METLLADSVRESPGARRFAEETTTATGGVGGEERLPTMMDDSGETPGAMARAARSSEAEAGAADAVSESREERPVVSKE